MAGTIIPAAVATSTIQPRAATASGNRCSSDSPTAAATAKVRTTGMAWRARR